MAEAVWAKAAAGASPNAGQCAPGQPQEDEPENRARATFQNGADREVPLTHHFDVHVHPPRIVTARDGGLRRV
jgi:hypothetical protein